MKKSSRKLIKKAFALMLAVVMAVPTADYGTLLTVQAEETISVLESKGYEEGAYVEWMPVNGANGYQVYVSQNQTDSESWELIDDKLIRSYGAYLRADALGLVPGTWYVKIEALTIDGDNNKTALVEQIETVTVTAHDRSGYAWEGYTDEDKDNENLNTPGAYKKDGSLKDDANVIYITNDTKDTVSLDVTGASSNPCVGLQKILDGYKQGQETKALDVRIIGNIEDFGYMPSGDINVETYRDRVKAGITIEGVGKDGVANGWGITIQNAFNVEVRNLGFMNCDSSEGDNVSLKQNNTHIWVHNCDFFYGHAGSDDDQKKGDGMLDCKTSDLITFSYNHFWDSGKSCLLGLEEGINNPDFVGRITYHHNWFDHSDSRHPRIRYFTTHIYNNYYDGIAKYGIGAAEGGASVFAESNYFRNCKYPMLISQQGSDIKSGSGTFESVKKLVDINGKYENGSIIKAYGNVIIEETVKTSFIPYAAPTTPSSSVQSADNGFVSYVAVDDSNEESYSVNDGENVNADTNKASDDNADADNNKESDDDNVNTDTDNVSDDGNVNTDTGNVSDDGNVNTDTDNVSDDGNVNGDTDKVSDNENADANTDNAPDDEGADIDADQTSDNESADIDKSADDGIINAEADYALVQEFTNDASVDFDAYEVPNRKDPVPATVTTKKGNFTYNNFDTAEDFYEYTPDAAADVPANVKAHAGRVNGGDFQFEFTTADDTSYAVNDKLKAQCTNYTSSIVSVGGINATSTKVYYMVTFDPGNGDTPTKASVEQGRAVTEPAAPANMPEGKVAFDGWYKGYRKWDFTTGITENITLVGKWLAAGEEPGSTEAKPIGTEPVVHDFTKDGKDSPYFDITGTLDPQGGSATYNGVTYASGNGKYRLDLSQTTLITFKTTVKSKMVLVLRPDKNGKKVKIDDVDTLQANGIIEVTLNAGDHSIKNRESNYLYAILIDPIVATITFNTNGGSEIAPQTIESGLTCTKPADPTKANNIFDGWYQDEELTQEYDFTTPLTADKTLYAKWIPAYTVTFETNGGSAVEPQTVNGSETCNKPADPTRDNYTFGGWYQDEELTQEYDFATPVTENTTIYAKWTQTYTVTFETDGGSTVEPQTVNSGEMCDEPANPTKDNNTFAGWYTDSECTEGNEYDFTTPVTADITLYAKWTPVTVNVKKNGFDIEFKDNKTQYTYTGSAIKPEITVKYNGELLYENTDYVVKYANNTKAASKTLLQTPEKKLPKITVTGKGRFSGSDYANFEILPKDLGDSDITVSGLPKTGEDSETKTLTVVQGAKASPVIYYNNIKLTAKDYTVTSLSGKKYTSADNNKQLKISAKSTNYKGELTLNLKVLEKGEKFKVSFNKNDINNLVYDGLEHKVSPVLDPSSMVKDTDYTVVYSSEAIDAGTVKCTVIGMGKYAGCSVTKTYKIKPAAKSNSDFTVAPLPNNGVYTFESSGVTLGGDLKVYIGAIAPDNDDNKLDLGKDYKVTYSNNKKAGTETKKASYKITFLGNYKGSRPITGNFTINKVLLCNNSEDDTKNTKGLKVVFPNKVSNGKDGVYKSVPYVSIDGIALKKSDYTVNYFTDENRQTPMDSQHKVPAGKPVYVKITGKGNYESTESDFVEGSYVVQNKPTDTIVNLSKASVTLKEKKVEYTGNAQIDNVKEITIKVGGDRKTIPAEKFAEEGISVEYVNNKAKGKATIVINGNGVKYVGSKTAAFTITARKVKLTTGTD